MDKQSVINRIKEYFHDVALQLENMLPKRSKTHGASDLCGITIVANAVLLVRMHFTSEQPELVFYARVPFEDKSKLKMVFIDIVRKYQLKGMRCVWLLQPEDYQFLLTDRLPVEPSEFQAAIRWKVKDLLTIPINDVVIDSFPIPTDQFSRAQEKIIVVAARFSYLTMIQQFIEGSGLLLEKIDIPELGLKAIADLYENDIDSTVFIYAHEKNIQLLIFHQKQFYFSRYLGYGLETMTDEAMLRRLVDRLTTELTRSFDYYQSHWHNKPPVLALIAATVSIAPDILKELGDHLGLQIKNIDIGDFIKRDPLMTAAMQVAYLPLIGSVLNHKGSV